MPHPYDRKWQELRARWAVLLPQPCCRCGHPVQPDDQWELDHYGREVVLGGRHDDDARPAHKHCNRSAGARLGHELRELGAQVKLGFSAVDAPSGDSHLANLPLQGSIPSESVSASPGHADSSWDVCPWLETLRMVPADACWPRYMTSPHPRAVGSFGPEFAAWSERRSGRSLRWWHQLAATRMLEHDQVGHLVWLWVLLSTSRQVGKSVLLGELALWRIHQARRWGEQQMVLMTSKDIPAAREVHRSARLWARTREGWTVREANGQERWPPAMAPAGLCAAQARSIPMPHR
jgi:hypothetical protein